MTKKKGVQAVFIFDDTNHIQEEKRIYINLTAVVITNIIIIIIS